MTSRIPTYDTDTQKKGVQKLEQIRQHVFWDNMLQVARPFSSDKSAIVNAPDCIESLSVLVIVSIFCKYYRAPKHQLGADHAITSAA